MGRRRKRSNAVNRQRQAGVAQRHFDSVLASPEDHSEVVLSSAAVHLMKTSQRHRLSLSNTGRERVCRKCWAHQATSHRFRVRIKAGMRVKTCLTCGTVRRFGGGPKHHRERGGGRPD
jgi:RNase P subunit RPR2